MSKFANQLRPLKIHNTHGLLERFGEPGKDIAISYQPADGLGGYETHVWSPRVRLDPKGHWMVYGSKTFFGKRATSWAPAVEWATATFGITDWVSFGGDWVPKYVIDAAKKYLKEHG